MIEIMIGIFAVGAGFGYAAGWLNGATAANRRHVRELNLP